ncbi:MAG: adenosylcobalamin-dependent ribonucleoside-diphosphate reductase, partial [Gammaproteobacteria bacterium]
PGGRRGAADAAPGTGPVAEMRRWDAAVRVESAAGRRGAMMATLRCDHPDIEHFIEAKRAGGALTCFNLSVLVTDAFLQAVAHDREWPLLFPAAALAPGGGGCVERRWSGESVPVPCRVLRVVAARALWQRFVQAACDAAEPGIVFLDRVNAENNLGYCEHIDTTNPCGEIPLPPDGACDLGSLVLPRYVTRPFAADAALDYAEIERVVGVAVRLLDNVIDVSRFALPAQAERARGARRIGIGVTGLADALVMLGLAYGSDAAVAATGALMRRIRDAAYRASSALAVEKGAFPRFDADSYLAAPFVARLPRPLRAAIARDGIRNSHLLAVAPAGTISLLAGNVSSGIEPVFRARYRRALRGAGGDAVELELEDHACRLWRESGGAGLPPAYVDAAGLAPAAHLAMQAAVQRYVDNAVSKTIHLGGSATAADVEEIFFRADALGLKGCTVYRPSALRGEVLRAAAPGCSGAGETP